MKTVADKKSTKKMTEKRSAKMSEPLVPGEPVIIEKVYPEIDGGIFPIKRTVGEKVRVSADIFAEGHQDITATLLFRQGKTGKWQKVRMTFVENDQWQGEFEITVATTYEYTIQAWVDTFGTWKKGFNKKIEAAQAVDLDLLVGIEIIEELLAGDKNAKILETVRKIKSAKSKKDAIRSILSDKLETSLIHFPHAPTLTRYEKELPVSVERKKALLSAWYEFFPRSLGSRNGSPGTFKSCEKLLPEIARMGFDVVYLPPVHPIGDTKRKGKNNAVKSRPGDVGSPWAIGSRSGGHKSIHPDLGSEKDFACFLAAAKKVGIEVALDLAFQCSPDHPYVREHPQWFRWLPDGTIQCAENPPKKYEDVLPINFDNEDWRNLWEELKSIIEFWIDQGIQIFRVDNPHTKPFPFWKWIIHEIKTKHPDVLFLSEAFTRPKVMKQLAKLGFSQSYTYFTWRMTKWDLTEYMKELTQTEMREYFRPNFWPNTPDILPYHLQHAGRPAFLIRFLLAATLSSNYGIYGPVFELCVTDPVAGKEEYVHSEKYEVKQWDWDQSGNLKDFIAHINRIRRDNAALQTTWNIQFCEIHNDYLLGYLKADDHGSNKLLVVVNIDPLNKQSGYLRVPLDAFGLSGEEHFKATDLLTEDSYYWRGEWNYVALNPFVMPAHILQVEKLKA